MWSCSPAIAKASSTRCMAARTASARPIGRSTGATRTFASGISASLVTACICRRHALASCHRQGAPLPAPCHHHGSLHLRRAGEPSAVESADAVVRSRWCGWIVPRPDVAYLLDADPEAARARKPEYPVDFMRDAGCVLPPGRAAGHHDDHSARAHSCSKGRSRECGRAAVSAAPCAQPAKDSPRKARKAANRLKKLPAYLLSYPVGK